VSLNNNKIDKSAASHTLHLAVLAALPLMALASFNASAACTTISSTDTINCTEGSTYTNPAGVTVTNITAVATAGAASSVVKMIGNGSTFINDGILSNISTYTNTSSNAGQKYGAFIAAPTALTDGPNTIINTGTISAAISDANMQTNKTRLNTVGVVGLGTDAEAEYMLTNSGSISATHNGVGRVNGVEAGGDVEEMVIVNSGSITGTHSHSITKTASTATSFMGTVTLGDTTSTAAANIGIAAGIYAEEEVVGLVIENKVHGTITGVGTYASGIYTRAVTTDINNEGSITGSKIGVAQVSDSGEVRSMSLDNSGTIIGDIMSVNGAALRWWSLSNGEGTSGATIDSRLNINSQYGQADSKIANSGSITGNFYYSNGTHELSNSHGATILGSIDLDQRNSYGVTGNGTLVGTKAFTFENAGTFTGNITVHTASSNVLGSNVTSDVTLVPTITGAGSTDVNAPNTANIRRFNGDLIVVSTAIAGGAIDDVTIAPKAASGTIIRDGQFYQVFNHVKTGTTLAGVTQLTSADELPATSGNGLVGWTTHINSTGALVLESEVNAANVSGATASAKGALASLMAFDSNLGSSVQNLASNEEVRRAGEQLRPEANNASTQAVMSTVNQVSTVIGVHQDQVRVASKSGVSSGEVAQGLGFWMQGFGFKGEQNQRGGVDGYSASTGGFIFGADSAIGNGDLRLGAALAYGTTTVDGQGVTTANRTNINSYQATVYGSWDAGNWYADAALGYGQHQYNTKRYVALANANMSGDHDADQYSAKLGLGYPLALGRVIVTPLAAMSYVHLDQSGYTESDATNSGAALTIGNTKTDSLRSGLGAKVALPLSAGTVKTAVEARALWNHEFADTNQDIAARFAAGTSFTTNGVSQARDSANLGLGLNMNSDNGQTFSVNYDAEVRSSYTGHTASIKFRYNL
jgi:outer membrane autotransporter protein